MNSFVLPGGVKHFLIAVVLIAGCSKWPPEEQLFRQMFLENQEELNQLVQKLDDTKYIGVRIDEFGNVLAEFVEGGKWAEGLVSLESPPDSAGWKALFQSVGLDSISALNRGEYIFNVKYFSSSSGRTTYVSYVHAQEFARWGAECDRSFRKLLCGKCTLQLSDKWRVSYSWDPPESILAPNLLEARNAGDISLDAYLDKIDKAYDRCFSKSRVIIDNASK